MSLFTPAWKGENDEKALAKINKIKSSSVLLIISLDTDISEERAIAAINRMENNDDLYDVVKKFNSRDSYRENRAATAAKRITDQKILADIAYNHDNIKSSTKVLKNAADGITDQQLLYRIVTRAPSNTVRTFCSDSITDQNILIEIAKLGSTGNLHVLDLLPDNDESIWIDIAWNAKKSYISGGAIQRITSEKELRKLLKKTEVKSYVYDRMQKLNLLDESAIRIAYPGISSDKIKVELDIQSYIIRTNKLECGKKLKELLYGGLDRDERQKLPAEEVYEGMLLKLKRNGYRSWIFDGDEWRRMPPEDVTEALIMSLKKDGYDPGIFDILRKIYDNNPNLRKLILDNTSGYSTKHYDHDLCWSNHKDIPAQPVSFGR